MRYLTFLALLIPIMSCSPKTEIPSHSAMDEKTKLEAIELLIEKHGIESTFRIKRGVEQTAALWRSEDGNPADFTQFLLDNFVANEEELEALYHKLERNFEIINGYMHRMNLQLKEPLHLDGPEITNIDFLFGSYAPGAHLNDDLFANKIALITTLNFPFYTLEEKTSLGTQWSRREWAYARMGDQFTARVPAEIVQNSSAILTAADNYISSYNIFMDMLRDDSNVPLFPEGMKLISHWGLRDELKSNYSLTNGLAKQRIIYQVMQRIIDQTIPRQVINKGEMEWNPFNNTLLHEGSAVQSMHENGERYSVLLRNFHAMRAVDPYYPNHPTYIDRAFGQAMEIPQQQVEELFIELLASPQAKSVAKLIEQRLGRPLEPFDIWYNGFKPSFNEDELSNITRKKYPVTNALRADISRILMELGWDQNNAKRISSLITVDGSRGAGHAWGAAMRNDVAHLRTRIGQSGMDYKGYNIAMHELGHCVEQTITMNDVDYYMLNGVPNTAFTEATAFMFQKRDLALLGAKGDFTSNYDYMALDNFWSNFEIMGVSLVDMRVWKWLYSKPEATAEELQEAVERIATDVWDSYYAEIFGVKGQTILAIYSHMIDNPLYLSNYPLGHIIDFQIEQAIGSGPVADHIDRMYTQGRLVPELWMQGAVGSSITLTPLLEATEAALERVKQ